MKAGQASNTAVIVAAGLQLLRHDGVARGMLPADTGGQGVRLLQSVRPRLARWLEWRAFRLGCHALERRIMPGILLHYALRKRALQQYARDSVALGVQQVVVLGAGLDTLASRLLAEFPTLQCIEVDHPATQRCKQHGLAASTQAGLHFLPLDLAQQDLAHALRFCNAFDGSLPTLFIAEGLLMYLSEARVAALLRQMQGVAGQSRIALTWFDSRAGFAHRSRWLDAWLQLRNEPFLSGMPRTLLPRFLQKFDYDCLALIESSERLTPAEAAGLPASRQVLRGEYICLAQSQNWHGASASLLAKPEEK